jgi:hypothetical protein
MIMQRHTVGLLWPLPMLHVQGAVELSRTASKVALGTRATSVLKELEALTGGDPLGVPVYVMATDLNSDERPLQIAWRAVYLDAVKSSNGGHPEGMRFRWPATLQMPMPGDTHWNAFVHVCSFAALGASGTVPITALRDWVRKELLHEYFIPLRPQIVCAL